MSMVRLEWRLAWRAARTHTSTTYPMGIYFPGVMAVARILAEN
jgi:hypothetical protein